jgi:hypothetical protein
MDFTALRTQVIALLQREQRLSYRALQRQFALDDADLEALKDELLYAKRLAVDEDGRVLVWTGGASSASLAPPSVTAQVASAPGEGSLTLQRHFSVLTKFAHVESWLSGRKRQREVVL